MYSSYYCAIVISWSKTRDALVLGYTLLFAVWAIISLIGQFGPFGVLPGHQASWLIAVIEAAIAVGFFVAGRSSMSKST